jgi:hypothetical protein
MRSRLIEPPPPSPDECGLSNLLELLAGCAPALPFLQPPPGTLALAPGGYVFADVHHPLSGAPLAVLSALLASRYRCVTAAVIETEVLRDSVADNLRQSAKDAIQALRTSLRVSTGVAEPVLTIGRGRDLAWKLAV